MGIKSTRRDFLKATAVAAVGAGLAPSLLASQRRLSVDRLQFAVIGCGGKGTSDMADAARFGDIAAICDIDAETRAKGMAAHPKAATFSDFRTMLEAMGDRIDAVTVSTADHTHAPASAMALKMGKHVFCQKPLTRTVYEARKLAELAKKHGVATQMGNQGTANSELRRCAAHLRAGTFGKVKEIHCWTNRAGGWWPQGVDRPAAKLTPDHVDWDAWIGPSPMREYAPGYHPFAWRGWWDFGSGALGDIGCHCMNLPFMAYDLHDPIAITAETSGHNKDSFPVWSVITYEFGQRGNRPPVNLIWYDGGKKPPANLAPGVELDVNGCLIVCENATIYSPREYGGGSTIVGGGALPEIEFVQSPGHFEEWVQAIDGGKAARSNFADYSGPLTEMVVLGNLAVWQLGERIEWDARSMSVKGHPELEPIIRPAYRKGWEL